MTKSQERVSLWWPEPCPSRGPGPGARSSWVSPVHCGNCDQWAGARLCFTPETEQRQAQEQEQSVPALRALDIAPSHSHHTRDNSDAPWPSAGCRWTLCDNGTRHYHNLYRKYQWGVPGKVATRAGYKERISGKGVSYINKCCLWLTRTGDLTDHESHHQSNWWWYLTINWHFMISLIEIVSNGFTKTHIHIQLTDR